MWTIAAANKKFKGPLGSYNGLTDIHLAHYFSSPVRLSRLKEAKLITDDGLIIPEQKVKVDSFQSEKKRQFYDFLAKIVVQNAAHKEGSLNRRLSNRLEDISKLEIVEYLKKVGQKNFHKTMPSALRRKKGRISPMQSYKICDWIKNEEDKMTPPPRSAPSSFAATSKSLNLPFQRCFSAKHSSPYNVPVFLCSYKSLDQSTFHRIISHKLKKKKKTANFNEIQTSRGLETKSRNRVLDSFPPALQKCKVVLLYHGHGLQTRLKEEIVIKQQHCGGTPVIVYRGDIVPNEKVEFFSLNHEGFSFSITVFLDGIRYLKLSSCCVFRYPINRRLGGANGSFSIQSIERGTPCLKCQYEQVESGNYLGNRQHDMQYENLKEDGKTILMNEEIPQNGEIITGSNEVEEYNSENTASEKENSEPAIESEVSIQTSEEIEDDLVAESRSQDGESEDPILEENHLKEGNTHLEGDYDSDSSIDSIGESVHDELKADHLKASTFSQSSSEDENGKQHVVLASVHGSPS